MAIYIYSQRIPAEYQEVEYIESSGTQYIQTSIIPSNTKGIYMRLSSQDTATDLLYIGSRKTSDTRFWIGNSSGDNAKRVYLGWNTNDRGVISQDTIFEVKLNYLNDRKKQVDSSVIASNIGTLSSSNNVPIYIFAGNDNYSTDPSLYAPSKIKLYSCKISDGSNIVNDFVPCYRKSDNVIGLYDLVNNQFYTNAGTGTFTKGADITGEMELKNAYIGEYHEYSYDFRNKTKAQVEADGWTVGSGYTFDANGMGNSNQWTAVYANLPLHFTNAKKIIYTAGLYDANSMNCSLGTLANTGYSTSLIYSGRTADGRVTIQLDGTEIVKLTGISNPSGQTSWTYTLDLENKSWDFVYNSITRSGSMTQTNVENIRNGTIGARLFAEYGTGRIQYIKIVVE